MKTRSNHYENQSALRSIGGGSDANVPTCFVRRGEIECVKTRPDPNGCVQDLTPMAA
jgi:hypothetical protein